MLHCWFKKSKHCWFNKPPPQVKKTVEVTNGITTQPTQIFLPNLAEVFSPLRPLLSINNEFIWTPACDNAFQQLKWLVKNIVEFKHFDIHRETRIVCDASHDGLGAMIEQYRSNGWNPISVASRYLNAAEKKYSSNEIELLAVLWATEHFPNYIYGRYFTVTSDHKALITLLNSSPKGNQKIFQATNPMIRSFFTLRF